MPGVFSMMTPMHYYHYAKKKRSKLLIISVAIALLMLFVLAPYVMSWKMLIPILFVIGTVLYRIHSTELYLFFGLRETDNLISLEEKFNTGLFSYTAMYRHKNNLEKGIFNFYSWF